MPFIKRNRHCVRKDGRIFKFNSYDEALAFEDANQEIEEEVEEELYADDQQEGYTFN